MQGSALRERKIFGFSRAGFQPLSGERTCVSGKAVANTILLSIPDREYKAIRPHLEFVTLPSHRNLHDARRKLEYVYFLNTGMVSLVFTSQTGRSVEVGVVGNEGFTPMPILVGITRSPHRAVVQVEGNGFKMAAADLKTVLRSSPQLLATLHRYVVLQAMQTAQTGGCNRLHNLVQRLARWLLLTQDRINSGSLRITHDFLATMLGTDRPSVTLAARALQRKGIIEYTYGGVTVLNRKKLENAACECYRVIKEFNAELKPRNN